MSIDWSEEEPTVELLKQTVTMHDVVEMLGLEPSNDKITSPWNPEERTPSCHVYEDHIFDYSTGNHADVIGLVRLLKPDWSFGKVVRTLWRRALKAGKEPGDVERQPVRQVRDFTEELDVAGPPWFDIYAGQKFDALDPPANCRVDDYDNLLIPHADQDGVYGVKVRHPNGSKDAWPGSQFTKRLYDPRGWVGPRWDHIPEFMALIAEGESDCWALSGALADWGQVRFLALPSGAQSWKDAWLEDLLPYSKIYLCMDNDPSGRRAREKLTSKVGWLRAEQLHVPPLYNDAREAIAAGWKPELK